ncbi:MAG: toprim domain-containing protein [Thermoplasmatota archaeon]
MRLKEKLKGTKEVLDRIKEKNQTTPIIVEGKKDVKALRRLGIRGEIIKIKTHQRIFHIIENLRDEYQGVIILTDWDPTGSRLYHRIKKACKANDIEYNERFRKELVKYVKGEVKDIEGLPKFIKRVERITKNPYNARKNRK